MKLLVNPVNLKNAKELISKKCHGILVGDNRFSWRISYSFDIKDILELSKNKMASKIFVNVNRIFFEDDLKNLENYLLELSKLPIDGVFFADYAVCYIINKYQLKLKTYYYPETLNVNYGQFDFFKKNQISGVYLSNELNFNEIQEMSDHKDSLELIMQVSGHAFFMHSRWELITNFFKHQGNKEINLQNKKFFIQEVTRNFPNVLYEDKYGTHMLTAYGLSQILNLKKLLSISIDWIHINSFLKDKEWVLKTFELYQRALILFKNSKDIESDLKTLYEEELLFNDKYGLNSGFLGDLDSAVYFKRDEK